ncbi:MAG: AAA family ATPase [Lachnospiraceae bacterium]|nr:AAA family ATPase [Lachnospiraceae bacterium]
MEDKKDRVVWFWRFVIFAVIAGVCSVLIVVCSGFSGAKNLADLFGTGTFLRSETVFLTVIFALLLPVVLIAITLYILKQGRGYIWNGKKHRRKEKESDGKRFRALCTIDETAFSHATLGETEIPPLFKICADFRRFAASKLHLYYEEEDIRRFIAGFAVSRLMIMQGLSGTGKTSLATAFGEFLGNPSTVISVQPMWKERADVIGYFNEFTKQFTESQLLKKLYEACYSDDIHIIVLDEMNIARVEYYFADFLSLMELSPDSRYLEITSDRWEKDPALLESGRLRLPDNVWFIGTANNDDSTFAISDKVYDRAMVMNLDTKAKPFSAKYNGVEKMSFASFRHTTEWVKQTFIMTSRNRRKMLEIDRYLMDNYHITYGNRIRKQMEEYVAVYIACGGTEENALDDFLVKKVLRKLEGQNPIVVSKARKGLLQKLDELFGIDSMPLCRNYLHFLSQSVS